MRRTTLNRLSRQKLIFLSIVLFMVALMLWATTSLSDLLDSGTIWMNNIGLSRENIKIVDVDFQDETLYLDICHNQKYILDKNKKTSIIIVYFNETISNLIRTLNSIYEHTPHYLLQEVILIDDYSPKNYIHSNVLKNGHADLKFFRNEEHHGMEKSRNIAAAHSRGEYLMFMAIPCIVSSYWLEPLIDRLAQYPGTVVSPFLNVISSKIDFSTKFPQSENHFKGGFDWHLNFRWVPMSDEEIESIANESAIAYPTPVTSGGTFIISKVWFREIGGFDESSESLAISLKIWMCGGLIEVATCSQIWHLLDDGHSVQFPEKYTDLKKAQRLAEQWMDDYKEIFYAINPSARAITVKSTRIPEARKRLQCHSFQWYLDTVFPELMQQIPTDFKFIALGTIKQGLQCIRPNHGLIYLGECYGSHIYWTHDKYGTIRSSYGHCLKARKNVLVIGSCVQYSNINELHWHHIDGKLFNALTKDCLQSNGLSSVLLAKCKVGLPFQLWRFSIEIN